MVNTRILQYPSMHGSSVEFEMVDFNLEVESEFCDVAIGVKGSRVFGRAEYSITDRYGCVLQEGEINTLIGTVGEMLDISREFLGCRTLSELLTHAASKEPFDTRSQFEGEF